MNDTGVASSDDAVRHIEHFMALGGEDNIGIGADFDGIDSTPSDIPDCGFLYVLFDKLLALNYSEDIINKISHQNFEKC
ncbi:MAG: dipeptidase [Clostridiales bacterium]|nr:MAG: dipeptidase [Clostridiales bacterium]